MLYVGFPISSSNLVALVLMSVVLYIRNSLSHEFYQVFVGDTRSSLYGWRQLAEWSIEHSALTEEDQAKGKDAFRADWEAFWEDVVKKHEGVGSGDTSGL